MRLLVFALLLLPAIHGFGRSQQPPPFPIPITDREPYGNSEQIELGGGRMRMITKNGAGQIITDTVFDGSKQTTTIIESFYPGGQPAEVMIVHSDSSSDPRRYETVRYDSAGTPQERQVQTGNNETQRERWNPKTKEWEPAPPRERWDPYTGRWESVPENERFDPARCLATAKPENRPVGSDATGTREHPR